MRRFLAACLAVGALVPVFSQTTAFEAASVKERATPADGSFVGRRPGGRFAADNAMLREILEYAYELQPFQLVGRLAPIESARWDITATLGSAAAGAAERVRISRSRPSTARR